MSIWKGAAVRGEQDGDQGVSSGAGPQRRVRIVCCCACQASNPGLEAGGRRPRRVFVSRSTSGLFKKPWPSTDSARLTYDQLRRETELRGLSVNNVCYARDARGPKQEVDQDQEHRQALPQHGSGSFSGSHGHRSASSDEGRIAT